MNSSPKCRELEASRSRFDGKQFEVVLPIQHTQVKFLGTARFEENKGSGPILRIQPIGEFEGHPELIVECDKWSAIEIGSPSGCDFFLDMRKETLAG